MRNPRVTSNRLRERLWRKFLAGLEQIDSDLVQTLDPKLTDMEPDELSEVKERILNALEATQ